MYRCVGATNDFLQIPFGLETPTSRPEGFFIMEKIYQRWIMLFIVQIINTELFVIDQWEFWFITIGITLATGSLFSK